MELLSMQPLPPHLAQPVYPDVPLVPAAETTRPVPLQAAQATTVFMVFSA